MNESCLIQMQLIFGILSDAHAAVWHVLCGIQQHSALLHRPDITIRLTGRKTPTYLLTALLLCSGL